MAERLLFENQQEAWRHLPTSTGKKEGNNRVHSGLAASGTARAIMLSKEQKKACFNDLDEALNVYPAPLDIINGPLMEGMEEVGRLFNDNELIVAEVLQSAEVMKAAVAHLEPHMEKTDSGTKKGRSFWPP